MSSHTAYAEVAGLVSTIAGHDKVIEFTTLLQSKPGLMAWLEVPNHERVRYLADHGQHGRMNAHKVDPTR